MKDNGYIVYMHISPSNKKYIGITCVKPQQRWANGKGYRSQKVFNRAIKKYGWENFKHIILLENLTKELAKRYEQYFVLLFKTNSCKYGNKYGYNMTDGGDSRTYDGIITEETRDKISNSSYNNSKKYYIDYFDLDGKYLGTCFGLREASKLLNASKENIFKALIGKTLSVNNYMVRHHDKNNYNGIDKYKLDINYDSITKYFNPVYQYSLDGTYLREFSNIREMEDITGFTAGNIVKCIKGEYNTSYGYIWSFDKVDNIGARKDCSTKPKRINKYDWNYNYICTYDSIADAKIDISKPNGNNINAVLGGRRKHAYGFGWAYADEREEKIISKSS